MTNRRLLFSTIVAAVIGSALTPSPLLADKLCDGTMKIIVPFGPAASISIATRAVADSLEKRLGQTIVVMNKAGANGQIAAEYVHNADQDFCTVGSFSSAPFVMLPAEKKSKGEVPPYDSLTGFTTLGEVFGTTFVFVVNEKFPAHSMEEFVAYAKEHPNMVNVGVSYSLADITLQLLRSNFGIELSSIPYRGADATSLSNLMTDEIQGAVMTLGVALPHIKIKRLRPLFVIANTRHPSLPGIPTDVETKIAELDGVRTWLGMIGPAELPPEKVKIFNEALVATLAEPEIVAKLANLAMTPRPSSPDKLRALIEEQLPAWEQLVKKGVVWFK